MQYQRYFGTTSLYCLSSPDLRSLGLFILATPNRLRLLTLHMPILPILSLLLYGYVAYMIRHSM